MILTRADYKDVYALDTEFIDTPMHSELISLAVVGQAGSRYFEFDYPEVIVPPWVRSNVVPLLSGTKSTFQEAAEELRAFIPHSQKIEFWTFIGAYDWYWLCRLFGGLMNIPPEWPLVFHDLGHFTNQVPDIAGPAHHAQNDATSVLACLIEMNEERRAVEEGALKRT